MFSRFFGEAECLCFFAMETEKVRRLRKLHKLLHADTGEFRRATERRATFAEQFQREQMGGAARGEAIGQARQREDIFGYFDGHVCHTRIFIAQETAFVEAIFVPVEKGGWLKC